MQGEASRAFRTLKTWHQNHANREFLGPLRKPFSRFSASGFRSGCAVFGNWLGETDGLIRVWLELYRLIVGLFVFVT